MGWHLGQALTVAGAILPAMALAALLVSILALLVAGLSALYTRKQANEAEATRRIEQDRRHDERQPHLRARVEPVSNGAWCRLWLELESAEPVTATTVEILGSSITFPSNQQGVASGDQAPLIATSEGQSPLSQASPLCWRVLVDEGQEAQERLLVTCHRGEERWQSVLSVDLPYDLLKSVR